MWSCWTKGFIGGGGFKVSTFKLYQCGNSVSSWLPLDQYVEL